MEKLLVKLGVLKPEATRVERLIGWFGVWAGILFFGSLLLNILGHVSTSLTLGQGAVLTFVGLLIFNWGAATQAEDEKELRSPPD